MRVQAVLLLALLACAWAGDDGMCNAETECAGLGPEAPPSPEAEINNLEVHKGGDPSPAGAEGAGDGTVATKTEPGSDRESEIKQLLQQQLEIKELLAQARASLMSLEQVVLRQDTQLQLLGVEVPKSGSDLLYSQTQRDAGVYAGGIMEPNRGWMPPQNALSHQAVLRGQQGWGQHMEFLSSAQVAGNVTAIHPLAQRAIRPSEIPSTGLLPKYVVIGNDVGKMYFFTPQGELAHEYESGTPSPVMAMSSLYAKKNETYIATSHANGEVRLHTVLMESPSDPRRSSRSKHTPVATISEITLHSVMPVGSRIEKEESDGSLNSHLHLYRQKGTHQRHIVMWFSDGVIIVIRTSDGQELYSYPTNRQPLAMTYKDSMFLALSAEHAIMAKSNLKDMPTEIRCEGLDGALIRAACFDPARSQRAYALSDRGDILTMTVPVDSPSKRKCKVSGVLPSGLPPDVPVSMAVIRGGYLVLAYPSGLAVFNATNAMKRGLKTVNTESIATLAMALGQSNTVVEQPSLGVTPDKTAGFVGVSLGSGLVGFFDGGFGLSLPPGMEPRGAEMAAWMQPLMIGVMLVVGYFQFNRARNRMSTDNGARGSYGLAGRAARRPNDEDLFTAAVNRMTSAAKTQNMGAFPVSSARRFARRDDAARAASGRPPTVAEEDEF